MKYFTSLILYFYYIFIYLNINIKAFKHNLKYIFSKNRERNENK